MFEKYPKMRRGELLAKHSWYGIGGVADFFIEVEDTAVLQELIAEIHVNQLRLFILGSGSNIIFHDEGFRGVVIKFTADKIEYSEPLDGCIKVWVDAGAILMNVVKDTLDRGLIGLSGLYGLPGTIGGAVFGNAGAHGVEIGTFVDEVILMDTLSGATRTVGHDYFGFTYRTSHLHHTNDMVVRVALTLKVAGDDASGRKLLEEARIGAENALKFRKDRQPAGRNNGSFFRNPVGDYAGRLIEGAGLKGYRMGGAYISQTHANFFMNDGTASVADILALRSYVQEQVMSKYSVELVPEVRIVSPEGGLL